MQTISSKSIKYKIFISYSDTLLVALGVIDKDYDSLLYANWETWLLKLFQGSIFNILFPCAFSVIIFHTVHH